MGRFILGAVALCLCSPAVLEAGAGLCEDERVGLRFLDFVTAPMSEADEKEWWNVGGHQFGLFAKRYEE